MKRLLLALLVLLGICSPVFAQSYLVVATCGTVPSTPSLGSTGPITVDQTGRLCTTDVVTGTITLVTPLGITPTDRTVTSATGASQQLMAANAARHSLTIQNTGNANCGVNPTGGTAAIGGAGTLTLAPLGSYTPALPTLSAITIICTAGQPIYANES